MGPICDICNCHASSFLTPVLRLRNVDLCNYKLYIKFTHGQALSICEECLKLSAIPAANMYVLIMYSIQIKYIFIPICREKPAYFYILYNKKYYEKYLSCCEKILNSIFVLGIFYIVIYSIANRAFIFFIYE